MEFKIEPDDELLSSDISKNSRYGKNQHNVVNVEDSIDIKFEALDEIFDSEDVESKKFLPIKIEASPHKTSDSALPLHFINPQSSFSNSEIQFQEYLEIEILKQEILNQEKEVIIILPKRLFNKRNFVCSICFDVFPTKTNLKKHLIVHKSNIFCKGRIVKLFKKPKKVFTCDVCNYKASFKSLLKLHNISHTGEKPFKCDICDYKTARSRNLKTHKMSHTGEKPFKCDQCIFQTTHAFRLKNHKYMHTGEKRFECDQCGYKSTFKFSLKNHIQSAHTGEKPFECDQCEFKSIRAFHMKVHKMQHTGEKPFNCDICDFRAARSSHIKIHKMLHTGEKPYKCDQCPFKSTRSSNLKAHKMLHARNTLSMGPNVV